MTQQSPYQLAQFDLSRTKGIATFLGAPLSEDVESPEIGIVGIPFDGAMVGTPGTRRGPAAIRSWSNRYRDLHNVALELSPFEKRKICDCCDLVLSPLSVAQTSDSITNAITTPSNRNVLAIGIGGDHYITYLC